jgi:transcriptional regulator with PAS, ATPase and Fis domain
LFGHKKGAFTGASLDRVGYFKTADNGTIFLDEVSEIPLHLQVKLLRAIEMKEIMPVGTSHVVPVDVRIIASTNRNLEKCVQEGKFREDLFYRLNVVGLELPQLSERPDDIPVLIQHFVAQYSNQMGKDVRGVDTEAMKEMMAHNWKGEVRELENIIERAVIFAEGKLITKKELPQFFGQQSGMYSISTNKPLKEAVADFEREYITHMLRVHPNKDDLAKTLNISLSSLYRKIEELNITSQS